MSADLLPFRLPTDEEADQALQAVRVLASHTDETDGLTLKLAEKDKNALVHMTPALAELVMSLLTHISKKQMVTLVPYGADLTTQKAADLLNVSRPFLLKLLEQEEIPHYLVGKHRRIKMSDIVAYRERREASREESLKKIQKLGQELQ
jgi:excisionase family DNA binding protein